MIEEILKLAVNAPSGDNSQPWSFMLKDNILEINNLPERDNKIFNFKQRGSYIAHGALISNIELLAPLFSYSLSVKILPDPDNENHIATIIFKKELTISPDDKKYELLIQKRTTNRKKYKKIPLTDFEKNTLINLAKKLNYGDFIIIEDSDKINNIAKAASTAERVMLQYKPLHTAFFSKIRWNKTEETKYKFGLLIDTLELLPPQKLIFKWFSNWKASGILRFLGFPKFIANENSKIYSSASAICAITVEEILPESFIKAGMLLQRLWLEATALNLSIQPIAGVLYLNQRLTEEGIPDITTKVEQLIKNSAETINKATDTTNAKNLVMLFRIGKAEPPSTKSKKFFNNTISV